MGVERYSCIFIRDLVLTIADGLSFLPVLTVHSMAIIGFHEVCPLEVSPLAIGSGCMELSGLVPSHDRVAVHSEDGCCLSGVIPTGWDNLGHLDSHGYAILVTFIPASTLFTVKVPGTLEQIVLICPGSEISFQGKVTSSPALRDLIVAK